MFLPYLHIFLTDLFHLMRFLFKRKYYSVIWLAIQCNNAICLLFPFLKSIHTDLIIALIMYKSYCCVHCLLSLHLYQKSKDICLKSMAFFCSFGSIQNLSNRPSLTYQSNIHGYEALWSNRFSLSRKSQGRLLNNLIFKFNHKTL